MDSKSSRMIYAALLANILIVIAKATAAFVTSSSAMLSEAVHSSIDSTNEVLLLYGARRSRQNPDKNHPFGYGREIYFWSFIVALLIFALGAGISFYEGIMHILSPQPIEHATVNYIVLGLSIVFESGSLLVAVRTVRSEKGNQTYWELIVRSKDPTKIIVLLEDSAAIAGLLIALAGTWASIAFDAPIYDGIASIMISLLLAGVAIVLARESKALLIGEQADPVLEAALRKTAMNSTGIVAINGILTSQISPTEVLVALSLEFQDDLTLVDVEHIIAEMETGMRHAHPEVTALFIKPQSPIGFKATQASLRELRNAGT
jgi:cation diffusion facilitator family transporter